MLPLLLLACGASDEPIEGSPSTPAPSSTPAPTTPAPTTPAPTSPGPTTGTPEGGVVELTTRDGLTLEGDYLTVPAGAPALCLLHMIPPSNDRTNWPLEVREAFAAEGWAVLAIDRRGAGASEGTAVDAYEGPTGKYDVEACVGRLVADGYGPVALLGASNGTTSILDYAVWAPGEGLPAPVALGYLTGGTYTENQNPLSAAPAVPAVFTYSTAERAWSVAAQPLDPGGWVFHEYADGDHGTRMFDAAPEVVDDLIAFLHGAFGT